jgi:hypothetical protein
MHPVLATFLHRQPAVPFVKSLKNPFRITHDVVIHPLARHRVDFG